LTHSVDNIDVAGHSIDRGSGSIIQQAKMAIFNICTVSRMYCYTFCAVLVSSGKSSFENLKLNPSYCNCCVDVSCDVMTETDWHCFFRQTVSYLPAIHKLVTVSNWIALVLQMWVQLIFPIAVCFQEFCLRLREVCVILQTTSIVLLRTVLSILLSTVQSTGKKDDESALRKQLQKRGRDNGEQ